MARFFLQVSGCLVLGAILTGCGGSTQKSLPRVEIKGTVTLDKQPMAKGKIYFTSAAPGVLPAVLDITDGNFGGVVEIEPGEKKVQIFAYKEIPLPPTATSTETVWQNYIPDRFNSDSEMK